MAGCDVERIRARRCCVCVCACVTASRGLKLDVISFNAAMNAKGGKWQRAGELLEEMSGRWLKPDLISCNAGISACEKCGRWGFPTSSATTPQSAHVRKAATGSLRLPDVISCSASL